MVTNSQKRDYCALHSSLFFVNSIFWKVLPSNTFQNIYEVGVKGLEPLRPYDQRILSP